MRARVQAPVCVLAISTLALIHIPIHAHRDRDSWGGGGGGREKKIWHEANFSSGRVRAPNGCGAPFTKNVSPTSSALTPRPLIFKSLPFPLGRGHATTHAYEVNGSERPRKVTIVRARGGGEGGV